LQAACPQRPLGGALDVEPDLGEVAEFGAQVGHRVDQRLERVGGERHDTQRGNELAAQDELGAHHVLTGLIDDRPGPVDGDVRSERGDGQQPFTAGRALDAVTQRA
jgi:hypothetical protein